MGTARSAPHGRPARAVLRPFLGRYEPFSEIERYDPGTDQWDSLRPLLLRPLFAMGWPWWRRRCCYWAAPAGVDSRQVPTRNVVGYDLDLDRWEDIGCALPWAWSLQCAVLQLAEGGDGGVGEPGETPDFVLGLMG